MVLFKLLDLMPPSNADPRKKHGKVREILNTLLTVAPHLVSGQNMRGSLLVRIFIGQ
eukprot:m.268755 g.268755  ORF g.268755 m.268755 type:complete len:57 (+) comp38563_c0_seq1:341-511(+)